MPSPFRTAPFASSCLTCVFALLGLLWCAPFVQATPTSHTKATPRATTTTPITTTPITTTPITTTRDSHRSPPQNTSLSPSMRVLWRLHQEQLRLVDTSVIYKGKKKMELTFLGGGYEAVFQGSPKSLRLAGNFHGLQIGGFVLSSIGLGATLAGTLIVIIAPQAVVQPAAGGVLSPELFWGLLLGGTVVSLLGSILSQSSYGMLYRAVDIYNRDKFETIFRDANQGQLPQAHHRRPQRTILYAATP